ncbi:MAG: toll/interleukin-1 receptor domain-containing protein [Muribaculaceae bacterium]|nr:toll/interleukin-1 receptor domain-containing protein [Muribaculaceae bacterium]
MARNIDRRIRSDQDFNRGLLDDICNGNYVLLLGSEVILNKEKFPESNGDSARYLLQSLIQTLQVDRGLKDPGCSTFPDFLRATGFDQANVKNWVLDEIFNSGYGIEDVSEDILKLLATKFFRVVMTTTIDPYLESVMEWVWGKDGFRIRNIYGQNGVGDDLPVDDARGNEYYDVEPTLYYVFGKADLKNPSNTFVLSDIDIMNCITKWLVNPPRHLMTYLNEKRIMAIGCNLNDWCFRFFWFAMRNKDEQISRIGDVALLLDTENSVPDRNLMKYLAETIKIRVEADSVKFLKNLTNMLEEEKIGNSVLENSSLGEIFISYSGKDYPVALKIFKRLKEAGFKVWLDYYKLYTGSDYEKRIYNAIQQCKIFIPLLSPNIAADFINPPDRKPYYQEEWEIATGESLDKKVLPIILPGYKLDQPYHQDVLKKLNTSSAFDWNKKPFSSFIDDLRQNLPSNSHKSKK